MSETDTEDGTVGSLHSLRETVNGRLDHSRVTRAVGDEKTIERLLRGSEVVVVPGNNLQFHSAVREAANLVVLHADIHGEHAEWPRATRMHARLADGLIYARYRRRHDCHKVLLVRITEGNVDVLVAPRRRVWRGRRTRTGAGRLSSVSDGDNWIPREDLAEHRALFADFLRERTRVYTVQRGHTALLQPLSQGRVGKEVAVVFRVVAYYDCRNVNARRLEVVGDLLRIGSVWTGGDTVVADEGVREDEDLTLVGWVGQRLGISDHTCVAHPQ